MTARGARAPKHRTQTKVIEYARLQPVGLSLVIWVTSLICLSHLKAAGMNEWYAILSFPMAVCAFGFMTAIAGWRDGPSRPREWMLTLLLISTIALLGIIRILLPVSLGAGRGAIWTGPLVVAGSMVALFLVMNLVAWYRDSRRSLRNALLGGTIVIPIVLISSALPKRSAVLPSQPRPADSPVLLLAVVIIALLAAFLASTPVSGTLLPVFLPAIAAAVFFALTRDLSVALALLAAGITTAVIATRRVRWPRVALNSVVAFAALASVIVAFGMVLRIPRFGFGDVLGYSERPVPFGAGGNFMTGAGDETVHRLWKGAPGTPSDVLSLIVHEAGVPCFIGLILLFLLFFVFLARLAARIDDPIGTAMAWGLIVFLVAQFVLAAESLFPAGVPIGEGPPLLSGGWADYLADLVAVGIVIGLSRRGRHLTPDDMPAEALAPQPPAAIQA
jgi:cell division protein FtsW (lipid II flippase)